MDKKCHKHPPSPFYSYKIFILCEIKGGKLYKGIETLDAKFFSLKSIPELSLDRITKSQLKIITDRLLYPELGAYCE